MILFLLVLNNIFILCNGPFNTPQYRTITERYVVSNFSDDLDSIYQRIFSYYNDENDIFSFDSNRNSAPNHKINAAFPGNSLPRILIFLRNIKQLVEKAKFNQLSLVQNLNDIRSSKNLTENNMPTPPINSDTSTIQSNKTSSENSIPIFEFLPSNTAEPSGADTQSGENANSYTDKSLSNGFDSAFSNSNTNKTILQSDSPSNNSDIKFTDSSKDTSSHPTADTLKITSDRCNKSSKNTSWTTDIEGIRSEKSSDDNIAQKNISSQQINNMMSDNYVSTPKSQTSGPFCGLFTGCISETRKKNRENYIKTQESRKELLGQINSKLCSSQNRKIKKNIEISDINKYSNDMIKNDDDYFNFLSQKDSNTSTSKSSLDKTKQISMFEDILKDIYNKTKVNTKPKDSTVYISQRRNKNGCRDRHRMKVSERKYKFPHSFLSKCGSKNRHKCSKKHKSTLFSSRKSDFFSDHFNDSEEDSESDYEIDFGLMRLFSGIIGDQEEHEALPGSVLEDDGDYSKEITDIGDDLEYFRKNEKYEGKSQFKKSDKVVDQEKTIKRRNPANNGKFSGIIDDPEYFRRQSEHGKNFRAMIYDPEYFRRILKSKTKKFDEKNREFNGIIDDPEYFRNVPQQKSNESFKNKKLQEMIPKIYNNMDIEKLKKLNRKYKFHMFEGSDDSSKREEDSKISDISDILKNLSSEFENIFESTIVLITEMLKGLKEFIVKNDADLIKALKTVYSDVYTRFNDEIIDTIRTSSSSMIDAVQKYISSKPEVYNDIDIDKLTLEINLHFENFSEIIKLNTTNYEDVLDDVEDGVKENSIIFISDIMNLIKDTEFSDPIISQLSLTYTQSVILVNEDIMYWMENGINEVYDEMCSIIRNSVFKRKKGDKTGSKIIDNEFDELLINKARECINSILEPIGNMFNEINLVASETVDMYEKNLMEYLIEIFNKVNSKIENVIDRARSVQSSASKEFFDIANENVLRESLAKIEMV